MKTYRTRIRERLRSARASAMSAEERREELRAAEARRAARHRREGGARTPGAASPPSDGRGAPGPAAGAAGH